MSDDEAQAALAERIRGEWGGREVREQSMFGGRSFLVDGSIAVAARRGGALLVRVDPARREDLLRLPGAAPARMGERDMGEQWIEVGPGGLLTGEALRWWLSVALPD